MPKMDSLQPKLVLGFDEIDDAQGGLVGGKGLNLARLSRLDRIRVPDGFCVTTTAFESMMAGAASSEILLSRLSKLKVEDRGQIGALSAQLRQLIESTPVPDAVAEAIGSALSKSGDEAGYAVRSSATAEDLPGASFAGQQDSFLNLTGTPRVLQHIRRCWASLFTDRAVIYRIQHGFDHRDIRMAVVVQKMIVAEASGVLFTANPVTGHRKEMAVEACFGLGEALVSGLVSADRYKVRSGEVVETTRAGNGPSQGRVLEEEQILELASLGRIIENYFGAPQDIEWCLLDGKFHIVQSRPITTLYPVPESTDGGHRVYVSVGHQQMMTDPMKPLGLSIFQLTAARPMHAAGGRLFVDITAQLAVPTSRDIIVGALGRSDPLIKDALSTILDRGDFIETLPEQGVTSAQSKRLAELAGVSAPIEPDSTVVAELVEESQRAIEALKQEILAVTGAELLDVIEADIQELKKSLFGSPAMSAIMAGLNASTWLNDKMLEWLGEKNVADALSQSVANNITSEMGLELLDVADVVREHPDVVTYLQGVTGDRFLEGLEGVEGGEKVRAAIDSYLGKYGMRCAGEIDITRVRWSENPASLLPLILSNVKNFEPGEAERKFSQGRRHASELAQVLLDRLRRLPQGDTKAAEAQAMIARLRSFIGYREYPKYSIVSRFFVYKQALLQEAERLVKQSVLEQVADIDYLTFEELREVVRTHRLDPTLIAQRKAEHERNIRLSPPRVLTSDGEILTGAYKRSDLPEGAVAGLAVSSGVVEGRARVILDMTEADLETEDILVTVFTDPSWTPLFVTIKGLVTEVGGLMTHGAVIAREYGLPAVVGVENATKLIRDGQRIRLSGTDGYVQILD